MLVQLGLFVRVYVCVRARVRARVWCTRMQGVQSCTCVCRAVRSLLRPS